MSGAAVEGPEAAARPRRVPVSTYRLQVNGDFTLAAARELLDYLDRLGVSDLYTSPLTTSVRGSGHGYDVTDPTKIDPEIGGEEALAALGAELDVRGMGLLLDVVPNHMAASPENPWWRDVLLRGRDSPYGRFFDIDWASPSVGEGKLLLPVLGDLYGAELEAGTLRLVAGEEGPELEYHDRRFPLAAGSVEGDDLAAINADPDALDRVLAAQHYRPAIWRLAGEAINYRRFFDITDLAALRAEDEEVFRASHELILRLVREGTVDGLRVDHVDGLRDPRRYLERLQEALAADEGGPVYVVVEKILAGDEALPEDWPVAGTTGYESLNSLTGLFVEPHGLVALDRAYARFTGLTEDFEEVRYRRKRQTLEELFAGEVGALARRLEALADADRRARDLPFSELHRALVEVTACLPVYRTYADARRGPSEAERAHLERALAEARRRAPGGPLTGAAYDFLAGVLALDGDGAGDGGERQRRLEFVARWQQVSGPAMAKGLEDTAFYVYNRLISLNAVGGEPEGIDPPGDADAYHRRNAERRRRWPYSLTASTSHDAKRSEDVRARVNVLSELAGEWERRVERWTAENRGKKRAVGGALVPDANEEIFLYQTLVGAWPLRDPREARFAERLEEYLVKAAREAKVHTDWLNPDEDWEAALVAFVRALLDDGGANPFLDDVLGFQSLVAVYGAWSALAQVVLQLAAPGVPDTYQGTELWNFSLVDPDNRRPVDWELRRRLLDELARREDDPALLAELVDEWRDGRIKLWVTWKALTARRREPELFLSGDYRPLAAAGPLARHVVAFARRHGDRWLIAAVPRWVSAVVPAGKPPLGEVWGDLALALPEGAPRTWRDVLSGEEVAAESGALPAARLFARLPVALLVAG